MAISTLRVSRTVSSWNARRVLWKSFGNPAEKLRRRHWGYNEKRPLSPLGSTFAMGGQPEEPATRLPRLPQLGEFRVGEWWVRQAEGVLRSDRKSVRLEPRVMDLLACLAARSGTVVSKDELLAAVWGGAFVEEGVLSQAIHSLRKALGDDARQPRYVQTLPKRGYRLLVPVVPAAAASAAAGAALAETAAAAEELPSPRAAAAAAPARPAAAAAERRQVTALSCGFGAAGDAPLDPEDLLEELPALQELLAEVVERFEGRLGPRRGRAWVAWFGVPSAHEDDARRAVGAALEIAARAARLPARPGAGRPRIGVHASSTIVSDGGGARFDDMTVSEAPEVASLIQSLAAPGEVLVSAGVHRLVAGFFACDEMAPVRLPGNAAALRTWRVLAGSGAQTRVEASVSLTPLVGREQELGLLLERWELAREGAGQVVLLAGEAGLGKSRLVWELRQRVTAGAAGWLEAYGSPYHRDSAFHPIRELLDRWLAADHDEPPADRLARLEREAGRLVPDLPQAVPLIALLLALPAGERHALPAMSPELRRRLTLEAVVALLLAMAERRPLLLVVEDLHWLDASSLELIGGLIEQAAQAPLLLLLTFRPELQPPWGRRSDLTRLTLGPLSRTQAGVMVERLTADRSLAPAVREQIAARTDGVPLFVEELTRMILEEGPAAAGETSAGRPSLEIPPTLEGWLWARLDRLGSAREIAQLAAVMGREVEAGLLHAVAPCGGEQLDRELDRLVGAEILFRRGRPPRQRYLFKHALLQDAAYASLLRADRRRLHGRIAEILEARFPAIVEAQPELLAHHFTEAGLPARAVPLWQRAADRAIQGSAYLEASGHLQRALALLDRLPESVERTEREIALQLALGMALAATRTFSTPEAQRAFQRAWELCGEVGQTSQVVASMRGLFIHRLISGDMQGGLEIARQLHGRVRQQGPGLLRMSHQGLGFVLLCRGELGRAKAHLEEAISLFESADSSVDLFLPGSGNLLLEAMANLSWTLWLLGRPDQALRLGREAAAQSRQLQAPFSHCFVTYFATEIHAYRREPEAVRAQIEELASLAAEQGFSHFISVAVFLRAWSESFSGEESTAIERMREGIEGRLELGARAGVPNHLALLAERCLQLDRIPEGLAAVEQALAISREGGQRLFDAELLRLEGELRHRDGSPDAAAEERFGRALDVARRQGARSLELRAVMSLARLWAGQRKRAEARELVSTLYGGFTEGFESGDLREARELLQALAPG
jgi:DNA-binding winged helix-turn-helix (wHTH) protein/predicted ATPase